MFVPEKMKLNKFKLVSIPRNRDYFARYGFAVTPASQYSGDEFSPMPERKIEEIEDYRRYAEEEASKKSLEQEAYNKSEKDS